MAAWRVPASQLALAVDVYYVECQFFTELASNGFGDVGMGTAAALRLNLSAFAGAERERPDGEQGKGRIRHAG